jgi:molybdopterin-guanine dinucleotide biosynthesis protein A
MSILGAIFAGGAARRFGSDKAEATIDGRAMIEHVVERLAAQCDAVVLVGRQRPGLETVADAPAPGLGPLGALAGALVHARAAGHALVLTSGCDLPDFPRDLATRLAPASAVVRGQPLLGLWDAELGPALVRWLEQGEDRSMRGWIAEAGARRVSLDAPPANINTPGDLADFLRQRGEGPKTS